MLRKLSIKLAVLLALSGVFLYVLFRKLFPPHGTTAAPEGLIGKKTFLIHGNKSPKHANASVAGEGGNPIAGRYTKDDIVGCAEGTWPVAACGQLQHGKCSGAVPVVSETLSDMDAVGCQNICQNANRALKVFEFDSATGTCNCFYHPENTSRPVENRCTNVTCLPESNTAFIGGGCGARL